LKKPFKGSRGAPDQQHHGWDTLYARVGVESREITSDDAMAGQERLLAGYRQFWSEALLLEGERDLTHSTLTELARRTQNEDIASVRRRCEDAVTSLKHAWDKDVKTVDTPHVERFYDRTELFIDELMWWHTLKEDDTPLAYVAALKFAAAHGVRDILDFLYVRHGFDVTLADISSVLLDFCAWRFKQRGLLARFIDLKVERLPRNAFDFVTAMDVFEHLTEPLGAVDTLADALKPGGYIFGRFASEIDPDRPMHIVQDFGPVFARFAERGFTEVWRDDWLWGHQVFRKPA
jgi:mycofactocin glycosyltransferase